MAVTIFFYVISALSIIGAIVVVSHKNPVVSAISLVFTFFLTAVLFVLLNAHFLAAVQVLVYAGAIIVLFLFTVMFLNIREGELVFDSHDVGKKLTFLGIILVVSGYFVHLATKHIKDIIFIGDSTQLNEFGTAESVGSLLFKDFLLPFELTSVLILVAIIGVVVIAKRRTE